MKYISDVVTDSISFIKSNSVSYIADIQDANGLRPLQTFIWDINWYNIDFFAGCVASGVGCGFEAAGTQYDDDLEPDEEIFTGVKVSSRINKESIVLSRLAYERLALRFLDFCIVVAGEDHNTVQNGSSWIKFLEAHNRLNIRVLTSNNNSI